MNESRKTESVDADALLRAMGRAQRETDLHSMTDTPISTSTDDDALVANITQQVLAQQQQSRLNSTQTVPAIVVGAARARRPRWTGFAAIAASVALAWILLPAYFAPERLPIYAAEVSGMDREFRGAAPEPLQPWNGTATLGNRVVVTLRPKVASAAAVVATLWHAVGNDIEALDVPLRRSPAGTLRLDAVLGRELALAPGAHRLWLVVARRETTPSANELLAITRIDAQQDRYVLPMRLVVLARP